MNKLNQHLQKIKQSGKVGLMTHVVIGYPSLEATFQIVKTMAKYGADIIELQIPFSDPLADGPTIMQACETALQNGTKVADAFTIMSQLSKKVTIPLLFMAYFNTVFCYGVENFCRDAAKAGAAGLIVPDMPIDEENQEHFYRYCKQYNLHAIHVVSPSTTKERLERHAKLATGFIYATARQGITGVQESLDKSISNYLQRIKQTLDLPVAVGFGISTKDQVQQVKKYANIAVVGSAIIDVIAQSSSQNREENVKKFLQTLRH